MAGTTETENKAGPSPPSAYYSPSAVDYGAGEEAGEVCEEEFWAPGAEDGSVSPPRTAGTSRSMQKAVHGDARTGTGEEQEVLILEEYESDFEEEED